MEVIIVGILIIILFTILIINSVRFYRKFMRSHFDPIKSLLEEPITGSTISNHFIKGKYKSENVKIELRFQSGHRQTNYFLYVTVIASMKCSFAIFRQGYLYRLGKAMGLIRNIKIGLPEFEKKYLIKSNNEIMMREFLCLEKNRILIEEILASKYNSLIVENEEMRVYRNLRNIFRLKKEFEKEMISELLDKMIALAEKLKMNRPESKEFSEYLMDFSAEKHVE